MSSSTTTWCLNRRLPSASPLIYAVYVGVAEGARDIAIALAGRRRPNSHVIALVGRVETALRGAIIAHIRRQ
jgi:hypothetical protein